MQLTMTPIEMLKFDAENLQQRNKQFNFDVSVLTEQLQFNHLLTFRYD